MIHRLLPLCLIAFPLQSAIVPASRAADRLFGDAKRIVFLGDSITYSGEYVAMLETALRLESPERQTEFINLGLPSETVSGLSEPGHADGRFPRPDLHERLARVLQQTKPDLVVACYGMNCGIYHPYSDERFLAYQHGICSLAASVRAVPADLVLLTPPAFDPLPILQQTLPEGLTEYRKPYRGYEDVLRLYSAWVIAARTDGWRAVDIHEPLLRFLAARRRTDPRFTLASDGIHLNSQGHWLIARELLREAGCSGIELSADTFGDSCEETVPIAGLYERIKQRQRLLSDAWLSATQHQRPGMTAGLPLDEAIAQAEVIERSIRDLLAQHAAAKP